VTAPRLETERLILRGHELGDVEAVHALWTDPAVIGPIGISPATAQDAWTRVLRYVGHWELCDYGYWAIEERASGRFVGELGFADWRRGVPVLAECPESGWVLASAAHGRGYAGEALRAALAWGDRRFGRTICVIGPDNAPSLRLARKHGYRQIGETTLPVAPEHPQLVFQRARPMPGCHM
jgi:RimJ/RimL family protein N-acetyltransferase